MLTDCQDNLNTGVSFREHEDWRHVLSAQDLTSSSSPNIAIEKEMYILCGLCCMRNRCALKQLIVSTFRLVFGYDPGVCSFTNVVAARLPTHAGLKSVLIRNFIPFFLFLRNFIVFYSGTLFLSKHTCGSSPLSTQCRESRSTRPTSYQQKEWLMSSSTYGKKSWKFT